MRRRLTKIVYSTLLAIFSTVSIQSFAGAEVYKIVEHGYLNSNGETVEASCRAGDQLVKGLCSDRLDAISVPRGERMPFPALKDFETAVQDAQVHVESQSVRCQVEKLRADQRVRMIAIAHCKPSHS